MASSITDGEPHRVGDAARRAGRSASLAQPSGVARSAQGFEGTQDQEEER
ncbi:hypothetical protein [Microbacterium halophytorum]|nr:hypothetical protein [Microbacterium halophytorum]